MVFVFMLVASPFPIPPLLDVLGHCMIILEVKVWLFIRANSAVAEQVSGFTLPAEFWNQNTGLVVSTVYVFTLAEVEDEALPAVGLVADGAGSAAVSYA